MIKPITKDPIFLAQKSVPATILDLPVAQDLKDTLEAHREGRTGSEGHAGSPSGGLCRHGG